MDETHKETNNSHVLTHRNSVFIPESLHICVYTYMYTQMWRQTHILSHTHHLLLLFSVLLLNCLLYLCSGFIDFRPPCCSCYIVSVSSSYVATVLNSSQQYQIKKMCIVFLKTKKEKLKHQWSNKECQIKTWTWIWWCEYNERRQKKKFYTHTEVLKALIMLIMNSVCTLFCFVSNFKWVCTYKHKQTVFFPDIINQLALL